MSKAPTPKKPAWIVSRCDVRGREAIVQFVRNENPAIHRLETNAPEFSAALRLFSAGQTVAKYNRTRTELCKAVEQLQDARVAVVAAEENLAEAAGIGGEQLAAADAAHGVAFDRHVKLARREGLLCEACEAAWLAVKSELQSLGEQVAATVASKAMSAIEAKKIELAAAVSTHLDELGKLLDLRDRGGSRTLSVTQLAIIAPPPQLPESAPTVAFLPTPTRMALHG